MIKTPILLITFNRPEETAQTLAAIKKVKPAKVYIFSDGPRSKNSSDKKLILQTRELINKINWKCEIKTNFQSKNFGCGPGPVLAINWFFSNEEVGIILEDDCVASQDFFRFCEVLLKRYKNNKKIMHISGNNFQDGQYRGDASYYFSEYTHNWGWATWKRSWKEFDFSIIGEEKKKHMWDMQWLLSVKKQKGLAILPNVNLVTNIGFSEASSHTSAINKYSYLKVEPLKFPLRHPSKITRNKSADLYTYYHYFQNSTKSLIINTLVDIIPESLKQKIRPFIIR